MQREQKLIKLHEKDSFLEKLKFSKEEEDRLRSMIQVQNKFRLSSESSKQRLNPLAAHQNSSVLVGASQYILDSPPAHKTKKKFGNKTIDQR
jgi:hypothetical protein